MEHFIGIDIAKAEFEIKESASPGTYSERHNHTGIRKIVRRMVAIQPKLVVMEATGGLEKALARALDDAGIPVAIINSGRCVISPDQRADSQKPTVLMPRSSPCMRRESNQSQGKYPPQTTNCWIPW
jgi:hypothetical protein